MSENKRTRLIFGLTTLFFWASEYAHVPYFTPYLRELGLGASLIGFLVGSYGFTQLCVRVPLGIATDLSGNYRRVVRIGCICTTVSSIGLYLTQNVVLMFLCRVLAGVAASTWIAFTVMYTGYYKEEERSKAIANINAFNNSGKMIAFFLGLIAATLAGYREPLLMSVLTGFLAIFFSLFIKKNESSRKPQSVKELFSVFKDISVLVPALLAAVMQFLGQGTAFSFTSDVAKSLGANAIEIGVSSVLFNLSQILTTFFINSSFAVRQKRQVLVLLAFLCYMTYCLLVGFAPAVIVIILAQIIGGFANSLLTSVLMSSAIAYTTPENKSTAMGLYQAVYGIGMTLGPVLMGLLVDNGGYKLSFSLFAFIALASGVAAMIFYPIVKRVKEQAGKQ